MNVDIGGGTSKIAVCAEGKVIDLTAVDVGARLVVSDAAGTHHARRGSRDGNSAPSSASKLEARRDAEARQARARLPRA